jgi:hypothetical protein
LSKSTKESKIKIQVLTGEDGKIIGTARPHRYSEIQFRIAPRDGETLHDLEIPSALSTLDADALHERLVGYLPKPRRGSREKKS